MKYQVFSVILLVSAIFVFGCNTDSADPVDPHGPQSQNILQFQFGDKALGFTPCAPNATAIETISLSQEDVDILHHYYDSANSAYMVLTRWGTNQECRWIKLKNTSDIEFASMSAEILSGTTVLYGYEMGASQLDGTAVQFKEYTNQDEITINDKQTGTDEYKETYFANGQQLGQYTRDESVPGARSFTAAEQQTCQDLATAASSLYNNAEGQRLYELIESIDFQDWMISTFGIQNARGFSLTRSLRWGEVKCLLGGLGNPVCATVTVVNTSLFFMEWLACDVIPFFGGPTDGCDNLPSWW